MFTKEKVRSQHIQPNSGVVTDVSQPTLGDDDMDFGLGILTFGTLGFAAVFGYLSARATENRRHMNLPKSTLAADAPNTRDASPHI